jgi:hypothetical protein
VDRARYDAVQLTDGNTFNFGYVGTRATGTAPGDYMVVGPDWKGAIPAKIKKVFSSSTEFAVAIFRTQLLNAEDMPNVVRVQKGYQARPLSAYLKQPAPLAAPTIDFPKVTDELVKQNFFEYLDFALQFAPAGPEETPIPHKAREYWNRSGQEIRDEVSFTGAQDGDTAGDESRIGPGGQVHFERFEEHQRLAGWVMVRGSCVL